MSDGGNLCVAQPFEDQASHVVLSLRQPDPPEAAIDTVLQGAWWNHDLVDQASELVERERLLEQIIRAGVERFAGVRQVVESSDQNDRREDPTPAEFLEKLDTVHNRQFDSEQQPVVAARCYY